MYFGDAEQWGPLGTPHLWLFGSVFRFDMDGGRWMQSSVPADAAWYEGTWHQLAAVWERGGKLKLYFDGKAIAETAARSWEPLPRTAFAIGGGPPISGRGWLPAVPFTDLGCTGPIVVRCAQAEGHKWIYALNITDREARLPLRVEGGALRDVASGMQVAAPLGHAEFTLRPYELRAWRTSPGAQISLRSRPRPPVETGLGVEGLTPPVLPGRVPRGGVRG